MASSLFHSFSQHDGGGLGGSRSGGDINSSRTGNSKMNLSLNLQNVTSKDTTTPSHPQSHPHPHAQLTHQPVSLSGKNTTTSSKAGDQVVIEMPRDSSSRSTIDWKPKVNAISLIFIMVVAFLVWLMRIMSVSVISSHLMAGFIVFLLGNFVIGIIVVEAQIRSHKNRLSILQRLSFYSTQDSEAIQIRRELVCHYLFLFSGTVSSCLYYYDSGFNISSKYDKDFSSKSALIFLILSPLIYSSSCIHPVILFSLWVAILIISLTLNFANTDPPFVAFMQILVGAMIVRLSLVPSFHSTNPQRASTSTGFLPKPKDSAFNNLESVLTLSDKRKNGSNHSDNNSNNNNNNFNSGGINVITTINNSNSVGNSRENNATESYQSQVLKQIISNVSHDMLSPLQALEMGLESLQMVLSERSSKSTTTGYNTITSPNTRIRQISENIVIEDNDNNSNSNNNNGASKRPLGFFKGTSGSRSEVAVSKFVTAITSNNNMDTQKRVSYSESDLEFSVHETPRDAITIQLDLVITMRHTLAFMAMIIDRSLDASKSTGGMPLLPNCEQFDARESISKVIRCVSSMQTEVNTVVTYSPNLAVYLVHTDKRWFEGNVLCVISNAVKFSQQASTHPIEIRASLVSKLMSSSTTTTTTTTSAATESKGKPISSSLSSGFSGSSSSSSSKQLQKNQQQQEQQEPEEYRYLRIEVTDSGSGLSAEEISRFFGATEASERSKVGGMGLGLFTLAKRIEALGGEYHIHPRRDNQCSGSVVSFSIPIYGGLAQQQQLRHQQQILLANAESANAIAAMKSSPSSPVHLQDKSVSFRLPNKNNNNNNNNADSKATIPSGGSHASQKSVFSTNSNNSNNNNNSPHTYPHYPSGSSTTTATAMGIAAINDVERWALDVSSDSSKSGHLLFETARRQQQQQQHSSNDSNQIFITIDYDNPNNNNNGNTPMNSNLFTSQTLWVNREFKIRSDASSNSSGGGGGYHGGEMLSESTPIMRPKSMFISNGGGIKTSVKRAVDFEDYLKVIKDVADEKNTFRRPSQSISPVAVPAASPNNNTASLLLPATTAATTTSTEKALGGFVPPSPPRSPSFYKSVTERTRAKIAARLDMNINSMKTVEPIEQQQQQQQMPPEVLNSFFPLIPSYPSSSRKKQLPPTQPQQQQQQQQQQQLSAVTMSPSNNGGGGSPFRSLHSSITRSLEFDRRNSGNNNITTAATTTTTTTTTTTAIGASSQRSTQQVHLRSNSSMSNISANSALNTSFNNNSGRDDYDGDGIVPPAPAAASSSSKVSLFGGRREIQLSVLVVDDSLPIVKMTKMNLEKAGHTVDSAKNGLLALAMMKERMYDVVLMDIQMPVMGGVESVRLFRQYEEECCRPLFSSAKDISPLITFRSKRQLIIGMSANGEMATREDALNCGMDAFLNKPFSLEAIMRVVKESLESASMI